MKSLFKKFQENPVWVCKFDGLEGFVFLVIVVNHFVFASCV